GPEGSRAHRLASGLDEWPRAARRPPPDLRAVAELDPPAERVDVAAFAAKALADGLVARLERLGLACTRLRVEAETEHGETPGRSAPPACAAAATRPTGWLAPATPPGRRRRRGRGGCRTRRRRSSIPSRSRPRWWTPPARA